LMTCLHRLVWGATSTRLALRFTLPSLSTLAQGAHQQLRYGHLLMQLWLLWLCELQQAQLNIWSQAPAKRSYGSILEDLTLQRLKSFARCSWEKTWRLHSNIWLRLHHDIDYDDHPFMKWRCVSKWCLRQEGPKGEDLHAEKVLEKRSMQWEGPRGKIYNLRMP
jgi:hypothetical protein